FLGADLGCLVRVIVQELRPVFVGGGAWTRRARPTCGRSAPGGDAWVAGGGCTGEGFVDREVGANLVLEAELPGVGFGGVILPKAAVGDAEAGVGFAFAVHAGGEIARGQVRPVVVLAAVGGAQFFPPLFWVLPLRQQQ